MQPHDSTVKNIILVHGGFVDGSGWEVVYKILKKDGYKVSIAKIQRYRQCLVVGDKGAIHSFVDSRTRTQMAWLHRFVALVLESELARFPWHYSRPNFVWMI